MASRETIFHMLVEAAELEHNILCSYLYAVFSLKQGEDEDLTPAELEAVGRWRGELMGLCVEEMAHLAQVCNLLVAVGSRAHFNRPNMPVAPGYHPAGIAIGLSPFDMETLDHFIFLERPEAAQVEDGQPFARPPGASPRAKPPFAALMPRGPDYATIGEFYAELRAGLEEAARVLGEDRLFLGHEDHQIQGAEIGVDEVCAVGDLATALRAIDYIVEQGEGAQGERESSHYGKFKAMKGEYAAFSAARPQFVPCRPVARNPVMHAPTAAGRVHVNGRRAAPLLDAANASYGLMLRCLSKAYEVPASRKGLRAALLEGAMASMKAVSGMGCALTRLPAGDGADLCAGMSFAMPRSLEGPWCDADARLLGDRFLEIAGAIPQLELAPEPAQALAGKLSGTRLALWAAGGAAP